MTFRADPAEPTRELLERHGQAFASTFGQGPRPRIFFSPGRVNLMGAHLDYNGGPGDAHGHRPRHVLRGPGAPRPTPAPGLDFPESGTFELDLDGPAFARRGQWIDYPAGVCQGLRGRNPAACGLDLLFGGNLAVGAGLSSSASICVGTAFVLDSMWGLGLSPMGRVHAALAAEREFVGVQCGIMDPYAVGLAAPEQLLWLDCKDGSSQLLPLDPARISIGVADTGVRRELAQGAFNERVAQAAHAYQALASYVPGATCLRDIPVEVFEERRGQLDPLLARRAQHVVHEVARTFQARAALLRGDLAGFGSEMFAAHNSLRDLYDVSCPELDVLVDAAQESGGVFGSRLTGAGFGGCVVMLIDRTREDAVVEHVAARFEARFGRRPPIETFGGDPGPREVNE